MGGEPDDPRLDRLWERGGDKETRSQEGGPLRQLKANSASKKRTGVQVRRPGGKRAKKKTFSFEHASGGKPARIQEVLGTGLGDDRSKEKRLREKS